MSLREYMAFKAGRAFRRGDTNFVDPSPTKGAIYLTQEEDGLVHFKWKNRETNEFVEDLIMFPGDASFVKVPTPSGRVYVLKFSSSAERHFFWMQTQSPLRDENFVRNLNRALEDADSVPVWMGIDLLEEQAASAGSSSQPGPPAASGAGASSSSGGATSGTAGADPTVTAEQAAQFRSLIASMTAAASGAPAASEYSLVDVLTPQTLRTLFTSNPALASSLFPFLPPDLPEPPSLDVLQRVVSSPQFRQAVASLDRALRTGMLQDLVRGLGLPSEAGSGVEAFLHAISEQAKSEDSSMDTE